VISVGVCSEAVSVGVCWEVMSMGVCREVIGSDPLPTPIPNIERGD